MAQRVTNPLRAKARDPVFLLNIRPTVCAPNAPQLSPEEIVGGVGNRKREKAKVPVPGDERAPEL